MITIENIITFDYIFKMDGKVLGEKHSLTTSLDNEELLPGIKKFLKTLINTNEDEIINKNIVLTIPPEDSFGEKKAELISEIPIKMMEGYKVNDRVKIHLKDGTDVEGIIKEEKNNNFIVDCNHPLASKTLDLEITITEFK